MSCASRIIEKLGGTRKAAVILGKPPSTIQSWKNSGLIPARHQGEILRAARKADINIQPADFFEPLVAA